MEGLKREEHRPKNRCSSLTTGNHAFRFDRDGYQQPH
jgi:hypothetical protein